MKPGSHPDTKMCSFLLHLNFTWPTFITGRPLHFLLDLLQNSAEAPPLAPEFAKISSVPVSACCVHTWGHIIMLYYIMQTILCSTSKLLLSVLKHFFPNDFCIEIYWMYVDKMSWIYSMCFFHNEPPWSHGASWATATQLLTSIFSFGCCSCSATFYGQFAGDGSLEFTGMGGGILPCSHLNRIGHAGFVANNTGD